MKVVGTGVVVDGTRVLEPRCLLDVLIRAESVKIGEMVVGPSVEGISVVMVVVM